MNEEAKNEVEEVVEGAAAAAEKEVVIPEFFRDLKEDENAKALWHYVFRTNGDRKPIATPDGLPHKLDFDWKDMFPTHNDHIEVEIGSGKGSFISDYAAKHPDYFIMGSEWDYTWAAFAQRKMDKAGVLNNASMLRGDVFYFLRDCVKDNTVDAFHMYFPDPWPKERHHKNRLLRPDFLEQVARVMKPGKRIFYWGTDHKEYNEVALEVFDNFPGCKVLVRNEAEPTEGIMTGFEKKYRKEGRPIYRSIIEFEK
ncbi:tRNA (guanine-N7-)-methyltransferase [Fibrobacter sp. UWH9]|uniref:tRNA (guanosine(46)-N7)-methyltransferase TrmB n=2 Tax=Fibrobacter TaxID=832 RepID=UPI000914B0D9|nr:tRNA (guanosine(46)-N7)-methyltransferase TrmB [Fibrobacter sp. UWH9]MCL4102343.1 tRNA (guanine-N(7)-)-methyltransferase [Fibrobacter succinogenes]MCQ2099281.1 tRNA (guanosine(46)-N7)-methyltransferase TrmB [Fibrobacter sp.]OWV17050.1 tRNA (guanosine(46)-N7)-methyltransferase TrmB [Fibrobacter sp. UWH1]SHK89965.1 tRNA (guanine-N7-)-methyltransferase [Fibrobacter sp. UWH6]SHL23210.1 tRNA (guanine-N7-)-methyltransferase [Fibrobacter sp. UWH5]